MCFWFYFSPRFKLSTNFYLSNIHISQIGSVARINTFWKVNVKMHMARIFLLLLFIKRALKMMKNGFYFIVIALLVAELFKILIYVN